MRRLIVNADDFGLSRGVNAGVIEAHVHGIVTSASLMVRHAAAAEAADLAAELATLGVGLHLDLGEWAFVADDWHALYERVDLADREQVEDETRAQLALFQRLCGRPPTHLDSHQHVHAREIVGEVVDRVAREIDVPVRGRGSGIRHRGEFYGQAEDGTPAHELITAARLVELIGAVETGTTELGCHPSSIVDFAGMYQKERIVELHTLCDPAVHAAIVEHAIELVHYGSSRA